MRGSVYENETLISVAERQVTVDLEVKPWILVGNELRHAQGAKKRKPTPEVDLTIA